MPAIHTFTLKNGLTVLVEPMAAVRSASLSLLVPAGVTRQPEDKQGVANLLAEMMARGAGGLSARAHSDALDRLGVQRGVTCASRHLHLSARLLGENLREALPLLVAQASAPLLEESALDPARDLSLQEFDALADDPQQRAMILLRQKHYPAPFDRHPLGDKAALEAMTLADVRAFWQSHCVPGGSILAVAGAVDPSAVRDWATAATAGWTGSVAEQAIGALPARGEHHDTADSAQCHLAIACEAAPETSPDAILWKAACAILSGGMSGRLFTEVREKRGLCYSVYATYAAASEFGTVLAYAGTTAPRAAETREVLVAELARLSQGVTAEEFARAKVGMKAGLVMQGESSHARAGAIANDQVVYGRPRTLEEKAAQVDALTHERVDAFVRGIQLAPVTTVVIGPVEGRL